MESNTSNPNICNWYLVKENNVNTKYPYSPEYGNVDECSFRTDCGHDINRQPGTRLTSCNEREGKPCCYCGKIVKRVIDANVKATYCMEG